MSHQAHSIEHLETRIAPASVFTYTDIDGDKVTVKSTTGDLNGAGVVQLAGGQLQMLDVHDATFNGANITFTVKKAGDGDGLAAVGHIAGGANDFGAITIKGDLGDIDCGSNTAGKAAIKSLKVQTMGRYGTASQSSGDLGSDIHGALGKLTVIGDVESARIFVFGGANASIGSVKIGGSLIGGVGDSSGSIEATGPIGSVKVGGDLRGSAGPGTQTGSIFAGSTLGSLTIGGSIIGGATFGSGAINAFGTVGKIKIGGNVIGGLGESAGSVECSSTVVSMMVGGSVIGGTGERSGHLYADGAVGTLKIGGDLLGGAKSLAGCAEFRDALGRAAIGGSIIGGAGSDSGEIAVSTTLSAATIAGSIVGGAADGSGSIFCGTLGSIRLGHDLVGANIDTGSLIGSGIIQGDRIGSVFIGGSILAGFDNSSTGSLTLSPAVIAYNDTLGSLTVMGSMAGSVGTSGDVTNVIISGLGVANPTAMWDLAIGKISVGGSVERARILGGYISGITASNGNAQIGPVTVGGDWIASDLIAGVQDGGTAGFGDAGDTIIGGGASIAKIASITIKGIVAGTAGGSDQFAFESHSIGSFKTAGFTATVPSAPGSVAQSPITADVTLRII